MQKWWFSIAVELPFWTSSSNSSSLILSKHHLPRLCRYCVDVVNSKMRSTRPPEPSSASNATYECWTALVNQVETDKLRKYIYNDQYWSILVNLTYLEFAWELPVSGQSPRIVTPALSASAWGRLGSASSKCDRAWQWQRCWSPLPGPWAWPLRANLSQGAEVLTKAWEGGREWWLGLQFLESIGDGFTSK